MTNSQELRDAILEYVTASSEAVRQLQHRWRRPDLLNAVRAGVIPREFEQDRWRVTFHGCGVRIEGDERLLEFDFDADGNPKLPPDPWKVAEFLEPRFSGITFSALRDAIASELEGSVSGISSNSSGF